MPSCLVAEIYVKLNIHSKIFNIFGQLMPKLRHKLIQFVQIFFFGCRIEK